MNTLEKLFKLKEKGTNVRTEIIAGITTFLAMSYILAVNPGYLGSIPGVTPAGVFMATFDDFMKLDIRVGTILSAKVFEKAKKPAYQLEVDFGEELGIKKSSAQITQVYQPEDLVGKQVLAVVNFPPRQIANFMSEILVLGTYSKDGVVLITPDKPVENGDKLG